MHHTVVIKYNLICISSSAVCEALLSPNVNDPENQHPFFLFTLSLSIQRRTEKIFKRLK